MNLWSRVMPAMIRMHRAHTAHTQHGSALIVSLLILLVMTLIGVTAMSTSTMEEKMAGNSRDMALAFQAAEAALRQGETFIPTIALPTQYFGAGNTGIYPMGSAPDITASATWSSTGSIAYSGTIDGVASQPRYIIEMINPLGGGSGSINIGSYAPTSESSSAAYSYRITARGTGGADTTVVMLQSYYAF